jgi:membrane-bound metal-dependent hydrolase YbcI (DUF457 family)
MPTPLGHALAGIAVGTALTGGKPLTTARRDLLVFSLVGQAPDLDFIPGLILGQVDAIHHGVSHSVGAALLAGVLFYLWGQKRGAALRWAAMGFFVTLSHVLLDALNLDTSYPHGVPLFWPFSAKYHLIYPWFLDVWRDPPWLDALWHNLMAMGIEFIWLGPVALGCIMWRRQMLKRCWNKTA